MSDLPRLKLASSQATCRLLLESALEDHSAPGAAERALCAFNLSVGAAVTATAVHAGSSSVSAVSNVGGQLAGGIALKWLGLGLLAGVTTLVSAEQAVRLFSHSEPAPAAQPRHAEKSIAPQAVPKAITATPPSVSESAPLPIPASAPAHADSPRWRALDPSPLPEQASEAAADPLQELQTIRRALAERAPRRALVLLDAFVARHPASPLLEECAVLRFDALLALDGSQARAQGEAFLRRYPRSAYADRVRVKLSGQP